MLLNILQSIGLPPTTKNYPVQKVNRAKGEKLWIWHRTEKSKQQLDIQAWSSTEKSGQEIYIWKSQTAGVQSLETKSDQQGVTADGEEVCMPGPPNGRRQEGGAEQAKRLRREKKNEDWGGGVQDLERGKMWEKPTPGEWESKQIRDWTTTILYPWVVKNLKCD